MAPFFNAPSTFAVNADDAEDAREYNAKVERLREREYPMLQGITYLDHSGSTLYAKSLVQRFSAEMVANLYGNPHSASASSQLSTNRVEDARLHVLRWFNADPEDFDVIFVANATAAIKLVQECFRDVEGGFWYGHHRDAHTSLVGIREVATLGHKCFRSDEDVEEWLQNPSEVFAGKNASAVGLFAYPAQSNMNGRRLPIPWCGKLRSASLQASQRFYSLLDASAFVSTSPLDLSNAETAPDFVSMSFYKIFGFPDLGALIVRKDSGHILTQRKFFGGGTVDMIVVDGASWHAKKQTSLHDQLEDGTLPFHNIAALDIAMDVHSELYGSMKCISDHVSFLSRQLYQQLRALRHGNGAIVCETYDDALVRNNVSGSYGGVVAFNLRNSQGGYVGKSEVERLASIKDIHIRTGGLCNPGGIQNYLDWHVDGMMSNFAAGVRCGDEHDIIGDKPTGVIRVSLGAMSTLKDVETFIEFVREFYVEQNPLAQAREIAASAPLSEPDFYVESLVVFPIKSCAGFKIPSGVAWDVNPEGLAWDRRWCLVHQGTGEVMSQKKYRRMTLIHPLIDLDHKLLRVSYTSPENETRSIAIPLNDASSDYDVRGFCASKLCGASVEAQVYTRDLVSEFFSDALGVECMLARLPDAKDPSKQRRCEVRFQPHQLEAASSTLVMPGTFPEEPELPVPRPIIGSNESPILLISRSSVNKLNEEIKAEGGRATSADVFRANIIVAENCQKAPGTEQPYIEETWRLLQIGEQFFQMLGSCRRCNMICINPNTAERVSDPFVALAKTRRFDNKVYFGEHMAPMCVQEAVVKKRSFQIKVGDQVIAYVSGSD